MREGRLSSEKIRLRRKYSALMAKRRKRKKEQ
jgi:hypothetical protein